MKKRLIVIGLLGMMVFGSSACGTKNAAEGEPDTQTAVETGTSEETEGTSQTQSEAVEEGSLILNEAPVSDREDYVGLQDLDIDAYVTLNDYKNMKVTAYKPGTTDEDIEQYIDNQMLKG